MGQCHMPSNQIFTIFSDSGALITRGIMSLFYEMQLYIIPMGEYNTILSAYTLYRHLG